MQIDRVSNESNESEGRTPKTRNLKIYSKARTGKYHDTKEVPEIRLCDNWLQKQGFLQGRVVTITATHEKLVIQLQPE